MHATLFNCRRLRILVLVDHVLVRRLSHQPLHLRLYPRSAKGGKILLRIPIQHQLIVNRLVNGLRLLRILRKAISVSRRIMHLSFQITRRRSFQLVCIV